MKTQATPTAGSGQKTGPTDRLRSPVSRHQRQFESGTGDPSECADNEITLEEHLRVQRQIVERAHRFWLAKGCALNYALDDWLKAEDELLTEFVKPRHERHRQPASRTKKNSTGVTPPLVPGLPGHFPIRSHLNTNGNFEQLYESRHS